MLQKAASCLEGHHGSTVPVLVAARLTSMGQRGRRRENQKQKKDVSKTARSTDDWCCKVCIGRDGKPFRNHGDRRACHKCGIEKGSCFLHKVACADARLPSTNLAQRQAQQQGGLAKQLQGKNAELEKLRKELATLRQMQAGAPEQMEVDGDSGGTLQNDDPVDLLKKQVAFKEECLRAAKAAGLAEDVAAIESKLAELRQSISKAKPAETQHEVAHRKLKKAKRELDGLQMDLTKAKAVQTAAAAALAEIQAAVRTKELQIAEFQVAFSETARAALPADASAFAAHHFTIAEEELEGNAELKDFCSDPRFTRAMDILRAKAPKLLQLAAENGAPKTGTMPPEQPLASQQQTLQQQQQQQQQLQEQPQGAAMGMEYDSLFDDDLLNGLDSMDPTAKRAALKAALEGSSLAKRFRPY